VAGSAGYGRWMPWWLLAVFVVDVVAFIVLPRLAAVAVMLAAAGFAMLMLHRDPPQPKGPREP
jgi:hypothetical protein